MHAALAAEVLSPPPWVTTPPAPRVVYRTADSVSTPSAEPVQHYRQRRNHETRKHPPRYHRLLLVAVPGLEPGRGERRGSPLLQHRHVPGAALYLIAPGETLRGASRPMDPDLLDTLTLPSRLSLQGHPTRGRGLVAIARNCNLLQLRALGRAGLRLPPAAPRLTSRAAHATRTARAPRERRGPPPATP